MHKWEDVLACKSGKLNVCTLQRSRAVQNAYDRERIKTLTIYESYEDKLKIELMAYQGRKNKYGKFVAFPSKNSVDALLIRNVFPYNFEKTVQHYVLFSRHPLTEREQRALIERMLGTGYQYETLINDISKMSIPNIWHCHVFIKVL